MPKRTATVILLSLAFCTAALPALGAEVTGDSYREAVERAAKLRAGAKTAAQHIVIKLQSNANRTNNQVIVFEFRYCRFEPARFT